MVFYKSFHGTLQNVADRKSKTLGCFLNFIGKTDADASRYVYGQPRMAVNHYVAFEELGKTVLEHVVYLGIFPVLLNERSETGKP